MTYENLLNEADDENIYVVENADFSSKSDGLINNDVIGINKKVRSHKKRACVLAEELGHFHTTVGDIINQSPSGNRKQEYKARLWAYNKMVGLSGIISAYKAGCGCLSETAEFLNVTEEFLQESVDCYKSKYGNCVYFDNYVIFFEPAIAVLELI